MHHKTQPTKTSSSWRSSLVDFFRTRRWPAPRHLAIALTCVIAVVALLAWSLSPSLMADEVSERLTEKLDMDVELDALEVGSNTVEFRDLDVTSPEGDVELSIERLVVTGDVVNLARREAGSVQEVQVEGARCVVDTDHPAFRARLDALRASSTDEETSETEASKEAATEALGIDRLLAYLDDQAVVAIEGARIEILRDQLTETLLEVTTSRLARRDVDAFDLTGTAMHGGGQLDWTLKTTLARPSVDGLVSWNDIALETLLGWLPARLPITREEQLQTSGLGQITGTIDGQMTFDGNVEFAGLTIQHERIAAQPVTDLDSRFEGLVELDWPSKRVDISSARLVRRDVTVNFNAEAALEGEDDWSVEVDATMPSTSCQAMIDAMPPAIIHSLSKTSMSGTIGAHLALSLHSSKPKQTELDIDVDDGCDFESTPALGSPDRLRDTFWQVTRGHDGEIVHSFETGPGASTWTPIEDVSPFFLQAVLAHEDAGFFRHHGFAVYAVESALERNLTRGKAAFGASTLSMQLAKNLFLTRDKTLARKAREVLATWWLEHHFDKREILELYVNVVEFGPEVFGIQQAAAHYFDRRPLDLTPAESVFLSTLLPAPVPRSAQLHQGLWNGTEQEVAFLLRHMARKGRLDSTALTHGIRQLEDFRFGPDRAQTARFEDRGAYGQTMYDHASVETRSLRDYGQPGPLPFDTNYQRRVAPPTPDEREEEILIDDEFLAASSS